MGAAVAKRGRPKKPRPTTLVAVRLDNSLVDKLKKSARENRHDNLSREIAIRLRTSFAYKRDEDPAVRALCFLIGELASQTNPFGRRSETRGAWRSNPFFYAAFKLAVAKLLEALTPPGEIIAPKLADGIF